MASGLSILLESLDIGTERSHEFAVSALLYVARSRQNWRELLLSEGPLPSIKAVAMRGSPRARDKVVRPLPIVHSPIHPLAGQPSPLNGGTAMEHRMSPLHQPFPNSPSLLRHLPSNNILDRIPTFEQLSQRQDESDNRFARRISEDASSVSTDVLDGHAETSWTVWSAESVVSVPCAPATFQNPAHPASYYPQPGQGTGVAAASAAAPSALGAPEAAGSAPTQLPPEIFEALTNLSAPKPDETENRVLLRQLAGAREIKDMARDKAALCGSMVERGAAEALLLLVNGVIEAEEGRELMDLRYKVAEEAAAALLNLSLDKTAKHMMRSRGVIPCVVRLAGVTRSSSPSHDDADARGSHDLPYDAQQDDTSSSCSDIGVSAPSTSAARLRLRELALEIIHSLAMATALKEELVDQSVVEPLVGLLREPACSKKGRMHALYTLYLLSKCGPGRSALVNQGAVPLLLEVTLCGTQKGSHLYAEQSERFFEKALHALANLRSRVSPIAHSPIYPSTGQPSPLNGGTAMEHRMSPLHQSFPNSPSPQQHPLSNNIVNRIPTFEQLSHRQEEPEDRFSRRSSEDASSVSTDVLDAHAETSWTVWSEDSAASVNPALGTFKSLEHSASYHPQGSHGAGVASAVAPSARGAPEAAGFTLTQLPPQFFEALNYLSAPQPGESEIHVLSRHLAGAQDMKLMARDAAVRSSMVEMGAPEVLMLLVNGVIEAEEGRELMDFRFQVAEEAAAALLNLSLDKTAKHMMRSRGVIPSIVELANITRSSPVSHDDARGCHALPSNNQQNDISSSSDGSARTARASSVHLPLRELAAEIIHGFAEEPSLREDLAVPGVVKPLVGLLREPACSTKGRVHALYTPYTEWCAAVQEFVWLYGTCIGSG
ncbi:unnamed protein product [Closterium sp. Yama58-4]|nr:unnamed protein product [Closterium sp. Yama58-4]